MLHIHNGRLYTYYLTVFPAVDISFNEYITKFGEDEFVSDLAQRWRSGIATQDEVIAYLESLFKRALTDKLLRLRFVSEIAWKWSFFKKRKAALIYVIQDPNIELTFQIDLSFIKEYNLRETEIIARYEIIPNKRQAQSMI